METLDTVTIHVPSVTGQDSARFHHATQNGMQLKTYKLFSGIFHLIFPDHIWPWMTDTRKVRPRMRDHYIQMANKHTTRCSTSLATREMPIKTTYHHTTKNSDNAKC